MRQLANNEFFQIQLFENSTLVLAVIDVWGGFNYLDL